jgi:competence protein ComEC
MITPRSPLRWLVPVLLLANLVIWTAVLLLPDDRLHVSFLDVGQGDAILIQTPSRHTILVDGGPDPQKLLVELGRRMPFWDRKIDVVVATQAQSDHLTGLVDVLRRYHVKQVLEPAVYPTPSNQAPVCHEWLILLHQIPVERHTPCAARSIDLGDGIALEVLSPPAELLHAGREDPDNNGTVLRLSWLDISFLFCADIRMEAEWELITRRAHLRSTVLKVAHHGSRSSTSQQFLAVVEPEFAVISAGTDNPFGHPHPEVLVRLEDQVSAENLFVTADQGTVELITDGARLWIDQEHR